LVALAEQDASVAAAKAAEWQVTTWTQDYRELLGRDQVDAVSICLPHSRHASAAVAAAEAGLHVLVEKPMATTLDEADRMITAARQHGVCLMVAENIRFDATYQRVAELLQAGTLGEIFMIRISREHQMRGYLQARPWFLQEAFCGIFASGGVHDFELLRMLAGEIAHVYALAPRAVFHEMTGEDSGVVVVGLANGAVATLVESFAIRTPTPGVQGIVHGSGGSLWFSGEEIRLYRMEQDGQADAVEVITVPSVDTFQAEIAHFLDCLEQGATPITSGEEERKPLAAVLAAYESLRRGARVDLI
jgi:predicted dehydrogenase